MKILYISKGDHVDYQDDCLCIGLKELFGADVVDINKRYHIYDSYDPVEASKLYGMGMSVTRVLPDLEVDRTDIQNKIKNRYFDYIIYGSIWRCDSDLKKVLDYYPKNKVALVDGEDETNIHPAFNFGTAYFKRELIHDRSRLFPISFAIPTSKVNFNSIPKTRLIAVCDPRDKSTYIYKNEKDYYKGYAEAYFGYTMKKAGWDCMRHYEILANECIPLFINLEQCPYHTMTNFPKQLLGELQKDFAVKATYPARYEELWVKYIERFNEHTIKRLTTKAVAQSMLDKLILCKDTK